MLAGGSTINLRGTERDRSKAIIKKGAWRERIMRCHDVELVGLFQNRVLLEKKCVLSKLKKKTFFWKKTHKCVGS